MLHRRACCARESSARPILFPCPSHPARNLPFRSPPRAPLVPLLFSWLRPATQSHACPAAASTAGFHFPAVAASAHSQQSAKVFPWRSVSPENPAHPVAWPVPPFRYRPVLTSSLQE